MGVRGELRKMIFRTVRNLTSNLANLHVIRIESLSLTDGVKGKKFVLICRNGNIDLKER